MAVPWAGACFIYGVGTFVLGSRTISPDSCRTVLLSPLEPIAIMGGLILPSLGTS